MNKYQAAAEAIRNQALKWKAIEDAAVILEEVGSLEQLVNEHRAGVERLEQEHLVIEKQIANAKSALADALPKAEAAIVDATAQAKRILTEAESKAKAHAEALMAEAQAQTATERAKLGAIKQEVEKTASSVTAARAELVEVEERLARARNSVKSLLGAGA